MFIPVTFELTILFASFTAVLAGSASAACRCPITRCSMSRGSPRTQPDGFFLAIEATDPKFERAGTFEFLKGLGAKEINEVEA